VTSDPMLPPEEQDEPEREAKPKRDGPSWWTVGGLVVLSMGAAAVAVHRWDTRPEVVAGRFIDDINAGRMQPRHLKGLPSRRWAPDAQPPTVGVREVAYTLPPEVWKRLTIDGAPPKAVPEYRRPRKPIPMALQEVVLRDAGAKCCSCYGRNSLQLDHRIPWARGGTNHPANIQVLCGQCNSIKGAKLGIEDLISAVVNAA
jgi:5-methylcytosine-specific restriction enzyme A